MNPLAQVLIEEMPAMIAFAQGLFKARNPTLPLPTSEEVIAAYQTAFAADVADDEAYRAAHPK